MNREQETPVRAMRKSLKHSVDLLRKRQAHLDKMMWLAKSEGMSLRDIAEIVGVSHTHVANTVARVDLERRDTAM